MNNSLTIPDNIQVGFQTRTAMELDALKDLLG